jgi:tRNA-Thr(GGU) m(6)t(6)A37 methyltransferase TsaA
LSFNFKQIGVIRTPYIDRGPFQPVEGAEGEFRIVLDTEYREGLKELEHFNYVYVIFCFHRAVNSESLSAVPPWGGGKSVGVFASRSPFRPNPIGLSIVRIKKIVDNVIHTSCIDALDQSPLLDIKPYIKAVDCKNKANNGWFEKYRGVEPLEKYLFSEE